MTSLFAPEITVGEPFVDTFDARSDAASRNVLNLVNQVSLEAANENLFQVFRSKTNWPPHRKRWPLQTGDLVSFEKSVHIFDCSTRFHNINLYGSYGGYGFGNKYAGYNSPTMFDETVTVRSGIRVSVPKGTLAQVVCGYPTSLTFSETKSRVVMPKGEVEIVYPPALRYDLNTVFSEFTGYPMVVLYVVNVPKTAFEAQVIKPNSFAVIGSGVRNFSRYKSGDLNDYKTWGYDEGAEFRQVLNVIQSGAPSW